MRTLILFAGLIIAIACQSQSLETLKIKIVNDSIIEMGKVNGRSQQLIHAPGDGKSIIIQSIDLRNKVENRLYSPVASEAFYKIGYQNGPYFYDVATINFDMINAVGNTTYFNSASIENRLFDESQTNNAPLIIKFNKPMQFTSGKNTLTLFITYRILN